MHTVDKKGFPPPIWRILKALITWWHRRRNLKLFSAQQQAVNVVQSVSRFIMESTTLLLTPLTYVMCFLWGEIWTATCKNMKLDHQLTPYTKINSRWIKDLNISHNTVKVLEENIGRKICHVLFKKYIDITPQRLYPATMCFLFMFTVGQWGSSSITLTSMTRGSRKRQKVTYELAINISTRKWHQIRDGCKKIGRGRQL